MCQVTTLSRCPPETSKSLTANMNTKLHRRDASTSKRTPATRGQTKRSDVACASWKLLANVYLGHQKYLFVKHFAFLPDLKHEIYLLVHQQHYQYEKIADKIWILGPNDETSASYTYNDGVLQLDREDIEDEQYDSWY